MARYLWTSPLIMVVYSNFAATTSGFASSAMGPHCVSDRILRRCTDPYHSPANGHVRANPAHAEPSSALHVPYCVGRMLIGLACSQKTRLALVNSVCAALHRHVVCPNGDISRQRPHR